jgi:hypothetical protein
VLLVAVMYVLGRSPVVVGKTTALRLFWVNYVADFAGLDLLEAGVGAANPILLRSLYEKLILALMFIGRIDRQIFYPHSGGDSIRFPYFHLKTRGFQRQVESRLSKLPEA